MTDSNSNNKQTLSSKKPILIMVFLHDDLAEYDEKKIYSDYFAWLKTELEDISGRGVLILFKSNEPGVTDYPYQNDSLEAAVDGWWERIDKAVIAPVEKTRPYNYDLDKFLLLTRHSINSSYAGAADVGGRVGMASISSYRVPAHEIGHMFRATHEDSEVVYNGWWNDSIMSVDYVGSAFRGNDYHFSEKNRENIRNHLSRFP
ncbi:zinc metalloprotease [Pseudomonas sp. S2_A02]